MGWNNPPIPWSEFERALSDGSRPGCRAGRADGGDSPAWSRKRHAYEAPGSHKRRMPDSCRTPSCTRTRTSAFSTARARPRSSSRRPRGSACTPSRSPTTTGCTASCGWPRPPPQPRARSQTVFGAELSLGLTGPQNGEADPEGAHLLVLARKEEGYHRLAMAITAAQLRGGEKGKPQYDLDDLAARAGGHWLILTGCRKGAVRQALDAGGSEYGMRARRRGARPARRAVRRRQRRGRAVRRTATHGMTTRNDALAALAADRGLRARRHRQRALRHPAPAPAGDRPGGRARPQQPRRDGWLAPARRRRPPPQRGGDGRALRPLPRRDREHRAARRRARLRAAAGEAADCPKQEVPEGHTPMSWLRELVWAGMPGKGIHATEENLKRINRELDVIEMKDFPGYFLIVHDIVKYAKAPRHPVPGSRLGRELRGLLPAGHHGGRPDLLQAAVRAVPVGDARRGARHRRRLRVRPARARHPVRVRQVRPARTLRRSPTS